MFLVLGGVQKNTAQQPEEKNTVTKISSNTNYISNENFTFDNENESNIQKKVLNEDQEKTLQSPVESHFALTPVTGSETSSPANGFASQECTDLLQQELDKLEVLEVENSKRQAAPPADTLLSPTDEHIDMFLRGNTPTKEKEQIGDGVQVENCEDNNASGEVGRYRYLEVV